MTNLERARGGKRLTATVTDLEVDRQKAFLVGLSMGKDGDQEAEISLDELARLVDTAGSDPVDEELVRRKTLDPATLIGSGKVAELVALTKANDIDVVVFDHELSPAQQRNLHKLFSCDVVDRIAVILDIFAQHATSREGMIQVELAQLRYRLPRLRTSSTELSRLGGGIGTRGPGETQLETDRRKILSRISKLERALKERGASRDTRRKARKRSQLPMVTLVGYTNAGKSTLFNRLTDSEVLVQDQLFATLDSTIRKMELPSGHELLMSDTVGFVRRLPHMLVEAFRSTLIEVQEADLLLHVVDGADPEPDRQIAAVRSVLAEIDAGDVPELMVINKSDTADPIAVERLLRVFPGSVAVSAATGHGMDLLAEAIAGMLNMTMTEVDLFLPYDKGDVVAAVHELGEVLKLDHQDAGTHIHVRLPKTELARFAPYAV